MKKKEVSWTDKQREIAELAGQGKEFQEIIALGYSRHMTSRVLTALKEGKKPEPKQESEASGTGGGTTRDLIGTNIPKAAPITFRVASKEIVLDPLELYRQYGYYEDLAKKNGGVGYSFSEVLTIGMQLVWFMSQDIPFTENMLRAVLHG